MKQLIIILLCIIKVGELKAQHCNNEEIKTDILTEILSREDTSQNGQLKYFLKIKANDTAVIDSLVFYSSYFTNIANNGNYPIQLLPNDSVLIEITLNYNVYSLPFSYKTVDHYIVSHKDSSIHSTHLKAANIYFTSYGTTEVWNMTDFHNLPRVWIFYDSIEPQRVYIHKDSIPSTNLTLLDSNHQAWEEDFQQTYIEGLPYAILMKALHPDTISNYIFTDSTIIDSVYYDPISFTIYKRFRGKVTGRLMSNYRNDDNVIVNGGIPLGGVKVELKNNNIINRNIAITYTDDNGNFTLEYDVYTWLDGDRIELFLNFETDCDKFNFKVKDRFDWFDDNPFSFRWHLGSQGANAGTISVNTITLDGDMSHPFRINSWTYFMYRFFENKAPQYKPTVKLKIKLNNKNGQSYFNTKNIVLEEGDDRHESVIWHELGHFVMYENQNTMTGTLGKHESTKEGNIQLAWSEGWATGFMGMLDLYYLNLDNESGLYAYFEGGNHPTDPKNTQRFISKIERRNRETLNDGYNSNGFRSEYLISAAINDLFDGPTYTNNPILHNDLSNGSLNLLYDDGYDPGFLDEVELNVVTIFDALNNPNISSVGEYYSYLMYYVKDCQTRKNIKIVFDQNRISRNTDDIQSGTNVLSTDEICNRTLFVDPADCGALFFNGKCSTYLFLDDNRLSGFFDNYNIGVENYVQTGFFYFFNKNVSDNLTIENDAILSFNKRLKTRFANNSNIGEIPPLNSLLNSTICANSVIVKNNGTIEVGDANSTTKASVLVNNGSVLELNSNNSQQPSNLIINDNSILVIQEGAILKYYPNTKIILNGPNAILEIRGQIQVMNGATFTVEDGAQGKGFVRFISGNVNNPNLINSPTNNGNVYLDGTNSNKTMEIIGNEGLRIGSDILEFVVENAQVKLGLNSRLKLEAKNKIELKNSTYDRLFGNDQYYGILIMPTLINQISNVNILNSKTALTVYNLTFGWFNTNSLNIERLKITNCEIGVFVNASSINYVNGLISGYTEAGIKSISQNLPNKISYVKINNSLNIPNADGIVINGNSVANALNTISNSRIENNRLGSYANLATLRLLKCNQYLNNNIGVSMNGWSLLDKSNNSYTKFSSNNTHFLSRFHGTLQMINGHNAYFGQNPNNLQTVFWSSLQPGQPNIINTNQINANANFFEAPLTYSLTTPNCWLDERATRALTLGNVNTMYSNLTQWQNNNICEYSGNPWVYSEEIDPNDDYGHELSIPIYGSLNNTNLSCSPFNGASIIASYTPLHNSVMQSSNPNIVQILPQLCAILNCNAINPTELHQQLLVDVYNTTLLAHSIGIVNKQVKEDSTGVDSLSLLLSNTIDNLINKSINEQYPWKKMLFELKIAKTEVQRLANLRSQAIDNLEILQTTQTDSFELELINRNLCIHTAELALLNGNVTIENMYDIYPCYSQGYQENTVNTTLNTFKNNLDKIKNNLIFYPNPTDDKVIVSTTNKEIINSIKIFNLEGKLMLELDNINNIENIVNIQEFNNGTYMIEVLTENNKYNKLLVKI